MNIVDRVVIGFALGILIVLSFDVAYNILDYFTIEEILIVLCVCVVMWQLLAMFCDELLKRINRPRKAKQKVANDKLLPIPKGKVLKPESQEDIVKFEPIDKSVSDIESKVDKLMEVKK